MRRRRCEWPIELGESTGTTDRLLPLAAELGSDVPFFLDALAPRSAGAGGNASSGWPRIVPLDVVIVKPPDVAVDRGGLSQHSMA